MQLLIITVLRPLAAILRKGCHNITLTRSRTFRQRSTVTSFPDNYKIRRLMQNLTAYRHGLTAQFVQSLYLNRNPCMDMRSHPGPHTNEFSLACRYHRLSPPSISSSLACNPHSAGSPKNMLDISTLYTLIVLGVVMYLAITRFWKKHGSGERPHVRYHPSSRLCKQIAGACSTLKRYSMKV